MKKTTEGGISVAVMTKRRLCLNLALILLLCLVFLPVRAAAGTSYLIVNGVPYSPTVSHNGLGWSYTYASGMGYLRLNGYTGGSISIPCPASVEYDGVNLITAGEGENALYCAGEVLTLGSSDPDAELTLMGGSDATAIFGNSVSLWGWGKLYAFGGSGSAAVWGGRSVLITLEQMILYGDRQMAITTDSGGIIKVSGAHKYYAGMTAETAVESVFYGGEFYLRAEPAQAVITFDGNGGTVNGGESASVTLTVTTSGTDLTPFTPQRENYDFIGWNTEPDGSGHKLPPRLYSGGEITYYAQWERIPTMLPIPENMLTQENALIYAALYYGSGRLWTVLEDDGSLSAFSLPELPEEGMTYTIYCVDINSYTPLCPPTYGTL